MYISIFQFLKLEDVGDQIRMEEWHIQQRGSLMAQLLHYTIDHSKEKEKEEREEQAEEKIQERTITETDNISRNAVNV